MRSSIRSMERYLGCLAVQAKLNPIAEDYVDRWGDALERGEHPPDVADLFEAAGAVSVPVLSPIPVHAYLRQCAKTGRVPDANRIVVAIAHAYAEGDLLNRRQDLPLPRPPPPLPTPAYGSSFPRRRESRSPGGASDGRLIPSPEGEG